MPVANVNLLWTRRFRGLLPLSGNAQDGDGTLTLVRPDEFEARTYQVVTAGPDGRLQVRATLSVETVGKMEVALAGAALIGVTDDDLYLFQEQRKSRFMAGRRVAYSDVALSREGRLFTAAFSDIMFASHTVALCDMTGKIAWTKDLDFAVARVALAPDGSQLVVGGEQGTVVAFDSLRSVLWEAFEEEPVAALAVASGRGRCVVGSPNGAVAAFDGGSVAWRADVGPPVVAVGISDEGDFAAVAAGDAAGGVLILLDRDGAPAWEYALQTRPTGLALAPGGTSVAVSTSDGGLAVFAFDRVEAVGAGGHAGQSDFEAVASQWAAGQRWEARGRLAELLQRAPGSVDLCDRLIEWDAQLVAGALEEAGRLADEGDFAAALARLDAARELDPNEERIPAARGTIAQLASTALRERSRERLAAGDATAAMEAWQALVTLCPKDREAHAEIAAARRSRADELLREGDARAAAGDAPGALELWRQANSLAPSDAIAARLREAEARQTMEHGMRLYQERRYPEAAFQFRKLLALDPNHEEAQRYLGYAQSMQPGSAVADRFTRLE